MTVWIFYNYKSQAIKSSASPDCNLLQSLSSIDFCLHIINCKRSTLSRRVYFSCECHVALKVYEGKELSYHSHHEHVFHYDLMCRRDSYQFASSGNEHTAQTAPSICWFSFILLSALSTLDLMWLQWYKIFGNIFDELTSAVMNASAYRTPLFDDVN